MGRTDCDVENGQIFQGIVAIVYSNGWRRQQLERSCVMNPRDDYAYGRDTVGNGSTMGDQRQKGKSGVVENGERPAPNRQ